MLSAFVIATVVVAAATTKRKRKRSRRRTRQRRIDDHVADPSAAVVGFYQNPPDILSEEMIRAIVKEVVADELRRPVAEESLVRVSECDPEEGTIYVSSVGDTARVISHKIAMRMIENCDRQDLIGTHQFDRVVSDIAVSISMVPWNDDLYGSPCNRLSPRDRIDTPSGRAIGFTPSHDDNISRIFNSLPPRRICSSQGTRLPQIWIPIYNHSEFSDSAEVTTRGVFHENGDTSYMPPSEVTDLGVEK